MVTNWLIMATAVWAATALVPGIHVTGGTATYLRISVVLGLVNAVLGPVVQLVTQSLSWLTMGLTALVLNGVLFAGVAAVSANLAIDTLGTAIVGALVIAVVATRHRAGAASGHPRGRAAAGALSPHRSHP